MFALVIIIFLFGLTLSYRSVEHQLEVAKLKSDFVSTVSHEFKSPITSIRQLAEMLQANRVPSEERRQRYYDVIVEQSERISLLIDNVLNFARMEEGKKVFRFEPTDIAPLLRDVAGRIQHQVSHTGFQIRIAVDDSLPLMNVDRLSFAEAVVNLLDNAVKYSGTADHVELRARVIGPSLVVSVQDFGIGIVPSDIDRVFERFYRGGEAMSRSVSGTGLGLTLVKQIVTAHHGSIHVESSVGKGSTFEIRLPLQQD
jgi:signal transduction histidine kinase